MADPPPEIPYEMGDLSSSTKVDTKASPADSEDNVPTTPPPNSGVRNERQRVRFNSSDVERSLSPPPPPRRSTSRDPNERVSSPSLKKPRPALSRNPSSYNSVLDNVHNIPLSPVKAKSAADAARRAQALAADAQRQSEIVHEVVHEHGFYDASGRWSPESEPVTEHSYTSPVEPYHYLQQQDAGATQPPGDAENTSEARELLRAHWKFLNQANNTGSSGMFSVFTLFE